MDFPRARAVAEHLVVLDEVGSTNDELASRATADVLPDFTVVVTTNQTAGRGRLDRTWVTPPGQALAVSVLLRPVLADGSRVDPERYGWIPLIAGLAMTRTVARLIGGEGDRSLRRSRSDRLEAGRRVTLKWPNDVLIDGRKVSGVLSTLLPGGKDVVVGAGLNLTIRSESLPVPTATSLLLAGVTTEAEGLADLALAGYLVELRAAWGAFIGSGADVGASGIRNAVIAVCGTLGERVRVSLPGGSARVGTAVDLDDGGHLRIRTAPDAPLETVAAGDVTHLRYE